MKNKFLKALALLGFCVVSIAGLVGCALDDKQQKALDAVVDSAESIVKSLDNNLEMQNSKLTKQEAYDKFNQALTKMRFFGYPQMEVDVTGTCYDNITFAHVLDEITAKYVFKSYEKEQLCFFEQKNDTEPAIMYYVYNEQKGINTYYSGQNGYDYLTKYGDYDGNRLSKYVQQFNDSFTGVLWNPDVALEMDNFISGEQDGDTYTLAFTSTTQDTNTKREYYTTFVMQNDWIMSVDTRTIYQMMYDGRQEYRSYVFHMALRYANVDSNYVYNIVEAKEQVKDVKAGALYYGKDDDDHNVYVYITDSHKIYTATDENIFTILYDIKYHCLDSHMDLHDINYVSHIKDGDHMKYEYTGSQPLEVVATSDTTATLTIGGNSYELAVYTPVADMQQGVVYYAINNDSNTNAGKPYAGFYMTPNGYIYATQAASMDELYALLVSHTDASVTCFDVSHFTKDLVDGKIQYVYTPDTMKITCISDTTIIMTTQYNETVTFTLYTPAA